MVVSLFAVLIYLIKLRRDRIRAEEWLERNDAVLFSHAKNIKTPEEILQTLIEHAEGKAKLDQRQLVDAPAKSTSPLLDASVALLDTQKQRTNSQSSSSRVKPPTKKSYETDSDKDDK